MNCVVCGEKAFKNNLCQRHYMRGVRKLAKVIDYWRIKEPPYKATHVKSKRNMGY